MSEKQYEPGTLGHMLRLPYTEPTPPASQESAGEAVKRYTATGDYAYPVSESADGEFVDYDDYAALTAELAEARTEVEKEAAQSKHLAAMQEQRDSLRDECERLEKYNAMLKKLDAQRFDELSAIKYEKDILRGKIKQIAEAPLDNQKVTAGALAYIAQDALHDDSLAQQERERNAMTALSASGREEKSNGR